LAYFSTTPYLPPAAWTAYYYCLPAIVLLVEQLKRCLEYHTTVDAVDKIFSLCLSVIPLRSVSCVFTIKIGLDWIVIGFRMRYAAYSRYCPWQASSSWKM